MHDHISLPVHFLLSDPAELVATDGAPAVVHRRNRKHTVQIFLLFSRVVQPFNPGDGLRSLFLPFAKGFGKPERPKLDVDLVVGAEATTAEEAWQRIGAHGVSFVVEWLLQWKR